MTTVEREGGKLPQVPAEQVVRLLPHAVHAVSYLERRTAKPVVPTTEFMVQCFLAALSEGLFRMACRFELAAYGAQAVSGSASAGDGDLWSGVRARPNDGFSECGLIGMEPPVACRAEHGAVDDFLLRQVVLYMRAGGGARPPPCGCRPQRSGHWQHETGLAHGEPGHRVAHREPTSAIQCRRYPQP